MFVYIREKYLRLPFLNVLALKEGCYTNFLIPILCYGGIGAISGLLGVVIQQILPFLITDFLPVELQLFLSWPSILVGTAVGVLVTLLFAGLPLVDLTQISPLDPPSK